MPSSYQEKDQAHFIGWAPHFDRGLDGIFFRASYRRVLRALTPRPQSRVLEIACGTGGFLHALLHAEPTLFLTGIDYTPAMLAEAEIKFKNDQRVHLLQGSAERVPLRETFDYVYCLDAFHHFQDADGALGEMRRVMADPATLIILDPIFDAFRAPLMACALPFLGETHITKYRTDVWHTMLARHRFKIIEEKNWLIFFKLFVLQKII